ncbi:MAG: pitrilysin family protein [Flavobacteriales bacterium]|jgi:predicted Zn-dependent peptidase
MPHTHCFTLPNGLRCAFQYKKSTVAHMAVAIKAGSRDELEHQQGLAHFIEHNLFKGTEKRKAYHVLSRLDDVGGELNAYTTKEETIIHASFLKTDFRRAADLVADVVFKSAFPKKELDKEKEVIKDEIHSYLDSPADRIFDDFEDFIFHGNALGRNILGTPKSVDGLTREDIFEFQGRTYTADRITLSFVGPFSLQRVEQMAEEFFAEHQLNNNTWESHFDAPDRPQRRVEEVAQFQDHYIVGWRTPGIHHPQRRALLLLNNILGGPAMNNRLGLNIREKHGIAYNIESFLNLYSDVGLLGIYLGCDPSQTEKAATLAAKEVKKLQEQQLGTLQLSKAKNQFIGQMALAEENGLNSCIGAGRALLYFGKVSSFDYVAQQVRSISAMDLMEAAQAFLSPNQGYELIYKKAE